MLLIGLLGWPAPSGADDAATAFAQGTELFRRREYVSAIAAFKRAYRLRPHHSVQCSIARCHHNLNQFVEAAAHYGRCLDEGAAHTPLAGRLRRALRAVEQQIRWVDVLSPGRGGTVHVDGKAAGLAPLRVPLNPGQHVIEVRRARCRPARAVVELVEPGQRKLTLVPELIPATYTPAGPESRATGERAAREIPSPPPRRGVHRAWFWTSAALTLALGGALAACGALTLQRRDEYNGDPTKERLDRFLQLRTATNVLIGLTAAAGASSTLLLIYTDFGRREERKVSVSVGVGGTF